MSYKIEFTREECIGCGACTICDNWTLESDGYAKPQNDSLSELACNQEAAEMCPINIIKIKEV